MDKELVSIADCLMGKPFDVAKNYLRENTEYVYRLVQKSDTHYIVTSDLRFDRVNFKTDGNDIVTDIYIG